MNNVGNQPTHSSLIHRRRSPALPRLNGSGFLERNAHGQLKTKPEADFFIDKRPFHSSLLKLNAMADDMAVSLKTEKRRSRSTPRTFSDDHFKKLKCYRFFNVDYNYPTARMSMIFGINDT